MAAPPETRTEPVTDQFHGTQVTEQYRWLEDGESSEVRAWSDAQNAYARGVLDNLPGVDGIRARVTEIMAAETVAYWAVEPRGGKLFAMKDQPPKQQPFLVVSDSLDDLSHERVLVDPNALDPTGGTSMNWFKPSPDGKLVAVCLSQGGDEVGDVTVYDVATRPAARRRARAAGEHRHRRRRPGLGARRLGLLLHPPPARRRAARRGHELLPAGLLSQAGNADRRRPLRAGQGLAANRRDGAEDRPPHRPRCSRPSRTATAASSPTTCAKPDGKWRQFTRFEDKIIQAEFGPHDDLYRRLVAGAPRGKILHVPIATLDVADAKTIVPEGEDTIVTSFWQFRESSFVVTDSRLYVVYQLGGPSEIRAFDLDGQALPRRRQLDVAASAASVGLEGDDILFEMGSYVQPATVYRYKAGRLVDDADRIQDRRAGQSRRRRGRARVRHVEGRHEGARQHPLSQRHEARRHEPVPRHRLRRLRREHPAGLPRRSTACCSTTASSSPWPTSAAAASTARPGTARATSPRSKTCSTTSPRCSSIWSSEQIHVAASGSRSSAAPTAGC